MIPSPEFFQNYFQYVIWGDQRQLELVRALPEAEVYKERGYSFGTIQKILAHEVAAQSVWLDRFEGSEPKWIMDDPKLAKLEGVIEMWPTLHQRGMKYLATLTPQKLAANLDYTLRSGDKFSLPLWQPLFHMCQHSYYHRSQLNSMIKQAGGKPKSVDYSTWVVERGT
jgi:uncharacterized damage-inducible protein DinB